MTKTQHKLKIWPEFFADVVSGAKRYEIRRNDRGFKVGDELMLQEWNPNTAVYSGQTCLAKIIHITYGADAPVRDLLAFNIVVLGIEVIQ